MELDLENTKYCPLSDALEEMMSSLGSVRKGVINSVTISAPNAESTQAKSYLTA